MLLPVALAIAVLGLVLAVVLWLRGRRGRALQALGFAALAIGLHLTGLLALVGAAGVALARWAGQLVLNPAVWTGIALLGLAVVLWFAGGALARRTRSRRTVEKTPQPAAVTQPTERTPAQRPAPAPATSTDSEFDDIEEILRRRGIE